jgi:hypothetical protein
VQHLPQPTQENVVFIERPVKSWKAATEKRRD